MNKIKNLIILLTSTLFINNANAANNVFLNTFLVCFEDHIDFDINDFCGKYREVVNYDNNENLTNMVVTFNPVAFGHPMIFRLR